MKYLLPVESIVFYSVSYNYLIVNLGYFLIAVEVGFYSPSVFYNLLGIFLGYFTSGFLAAFLSSFLVSFLEVFFYLLS